MRLLFRLVGLSCVLGTFGVTVIRKNDASIGPQSDLFIGNNIIAPDGFSRAAVLAGSASDRLSFPGPVIRANKGDKFRLNVVDELTDAGMMTSTSIHWHGFVQKESSWADGVAGVTQCPITPGQSFVYQFSSRDQAGTFWYHSHYSTQYCDGLRGPIVVYDPEDPHKGLYDIDDESTIITLADWYHLTAPVAQRQVIPNIDATLINGLGRYAGGPPTDLSVINVSPNKRYRFRLVSISCYPNFNFSIDGHSLKIIEADAVNVEPLVVDQIQIFAGQRYSFVMETNQPVGNYWIRSDPNLGNTGFKEGINSAILRYRGAPNVDPTTTSSIRNPLLETNLHPLSNPAAPGVPSHGTADLSLNLNITFDRSLVKFTVNGAVFKAPTVPVLLQILSGTQNAHDLLPSGSIYALPPNKVIEISMPGGSGLSGSPHPIHMHGHSFSVVRSAGSSVYNYENPVRRDVVNLGMTGDNVTIRFTTDNSGPWIMHCHIDWHLELGLSVVFAENAPAIADRKPPPAWDELCPAFNALAPQTFAP